MCICLLNFKFFPSSSIFFSSLSFSISLSWKFRTLIYIHNKYYLSLASCKFCDMKFVVYAMVCSAGWLWLIRLGTLANRNDSLLSDGSNFGQFLQGFISYSWEIERASLCSLALLLGSVLSRWQIIFCVYKLNNC